MRLNIPVLKNVTACVISFCLINVQVLPGYTSFLARDTVNVAYIGTQFHNVSPDKQHNIENRISSLFQEEPGFYNIPEKEIQALGASLVDRIKNKMQKEDLRTAAEQLNADHVFVANLENQSSNQETIVLVGNMVRYDYAAGKAYNLKIKTLFEDFDEALARIKDQLIQPIVPEEKKSIFKRYLPGFLILAATAVAVTLLLTKTKGQNSGDNGVPTPPFTN